jgi:hypothetical protein
MEALFPLVAAFIAFVVGAFAFARVGRWLVGIHSTRSRGAALVSSIVLASGPWVIVALALVSVNIASATWAWWAFGGFAASIGVFGALTVYMWWKGKQREKANAA